MGDPALKEEKVEETPKEETPKPEEKSDLDKHREEILKTAEEKEEKEEKAKEEFVQEDIDMDGVKEKHPIIDKLGLKHSSVTELLEDLLTRYAGGHEEFQQNAEFIADLKKEGIVSATQRDELLAKLRAKQDVTPPAKPEPEKTFADTRSERLKSFVPKQGRDPESGELRPLTEEEAKLEHQRLNDFFEAAIPAETVDTVSRLEVDTTNLQDQLSFALFRLQPILKEFEDKVLPETIYQELLDFSDKFPRTCAEIIDTARKKGENFYGPLYHHFITTTKKEQIEAEQKKKWEEERTKEEEKKKVGASVEKGKKTGEPAGTPTAFKQKSLMDKRKAIEDTD